MTLQFSPPSLALMPALRAALVDDLPGSSLHYFARTHIDNAGMLAAINKPPMTRLAADGKIVERVPETFFILHDAQTILGVTSLRHRLTPELELQGGHIGYAVARQQQGRGYATLLLRHALQQARQQLNLDRALVTIDETNAASIRVVEKCGARLADVIDHPYRPGLRHCRYWIDLL